MCVSLCFALHSAPPPTVAQIGHELVGNQCRSIVAITTSGGTWNKQIVVTVPFSSAENVISLFSTWKKQSALETTLESIKKSLLFFLKTHHGTWKWNIIRDLKKRSVFKCQTKNSNDSLMLSSANSENFKCQEVVCRYRCFCGTWNQWIVQVPTHIDENHKDIVWFSSADFKCRCFCSRIECLVDC